MIIIPLPTQYNAGGRPAESRFGANSIRQPPGIGRD
jgi:hypothetical protein